MLATLRRIVTTAQRRIVRWSLQSTIVLWSLMAISLFAFPHPASVIVKIVQYTLLYCGAVTLLIKLAPRSRRTGQIIIALWITMFALERALLPHLGGVVYDLVYLAEALIVALLVPTTLTFIIFLIGRGIVRRRRRPKSHRGKIIFGAMLGSVLLAPRGTKFAAAFGGALGAAAGTRRRRGPTKPL